MKRIHIVGSGPRTGTTLLMEAMKVCFNFDAYPDHEASIHIASSEIASQGDDIILSKNPGDINLMDWSLFFDKSLYVIFVLRDPRDMVVSRHGAHPNVYYCSLKFVKKFEANIGNLKTNRRFLLIKYEDLVRNPDCVQRVIQNEFPFLLKEHRFSEYHRYARTTKGSQNALKGVRPIKPKSVGKWKKNLKRIRHQIYLHGDISDFLIKYGYEDNDKWIKLLEETPLEQTETKLGEFYSQKSKSQIIRKLIIATNAVAESLNFNPESAKKIFRPLKKLINDKILNHR